jgi:hypothetical protein
MRGLSKFAAKCVRFDTRSAIVGFRHGRLLAHHCHTTNSTRKRLITSMLEAVRLRTLVIGNSSSGKSRLAEGLGALIHAPVFDLDLIHWTPNPVVPSEDGLSLQPWRGEPLTVGHELNKLAFNAFRPRRSAGERMRTRLGTGGAT